MSGDRHATFPSGVLALNLWPDQPQGLYLLTPGPPFIELLPAKEGAPEDEPCTLLLAKAQQGEEYEMVLTDHASLTRCPPGPARPALRGAGAQLTSSYCCPSGTTWVM